MDGWIDWRPDLAAAGSAWVRSSCCRRGWRRSRVKLTAEMFSFGRANRSNEVPEIGFGDGHARQHLVRSTALIVAALVNE
jgi:hypothetical protein